MEELNNENKTPVNQIHIEQNAREHLANERTLLAWIRTSIGIMAFGFVMFKFSLFIKQVSLLIDNKSTVVIQHGYSSYIGIVLVVVGAIILPLSYVKYKKTEKQLNSQTFESSSQFVFLLTIIIFFISMLLLLYLVESTNKYL